MPTRAVRQLNALDADRDLLQADLDFRQIRLNELLSGIQFYERLARAGGADFSSESAMSAESRLCLANPSPRQ
jgi:hypothetical protein